MIEKHSFFALGIIYFARFSPVDVLGPHVLYLILLRLSLLPQVLLVTVSTVV